MGQLASQLFPWPGVCYSLIIPITNEQIKGPEFILSVLFALESVAVNCQDEIQRAVTISEASHH